MAPHTFRFLEYLIGINFRCDRNDRISRVYIFADLPSKCCENPRNCLKMTEFSKISFFAGTNFHKLYQKPRNPRKLIPAKIYTDKVAHADFSNNEVPCTHTLYYQVIPGNLQKRISSNYSLLRCKTLPAHFSANLLADCLLKFV